MASGKMAIKAVKLTVSSETVLWGLGDPVFDKLHADLEKAMLSINAVTVLNMAQDLGEVK